MPNISPTTPKYKRDLLIAEKAVNNLKMHGFDAVFAADAASAKALALESIPTTDTIGFGGSMTIEQLGLLDALEQRGNYLFDRRKAPSREEALEIMRQALLCDTFLMSANAISSDGTIFNIDGTGNRLAALAYGPKKVIILAGINKITPDRESAITRARSYAAPINAQRFNINTPCSHDGVCHNCTSNDCICSHILETRLSKPHGRIRVILFGEEMGM